MIWYKFKQNDNANKIQPNQTKQKQSRMAVVDMSSFCLRKTKKHKTDLYLEVFHTKSSEFEMAPFE